MSYTIENGIPVFQLTTPKAQRWKEHVIDLSTPVPPPEPLLVQSGSGIPLLYKRGIHVSSGKQKAGKTFYNSILITALLNEEGFFGFTPTSTGYKIMFADTEQDISDTQEVIRRIHRLNDWPVDRNVSSLVGTNLRELSAPDRIEVIEESLKAVRPDVIFIDGIVDLCMDFNDLAEGHAVTTMFMKWAVKYDVAIVTALHENKGDDNLRGHLGTFLAQKGESVVRIKKEDDGTQVYMGCKVVDSRHQPVEEFHFRIDHGLPVMYDPLTGDKPNVKGIDYDGVFRDILAFGGLEYKDLVVKVSSHTGKSNETARKYISEAKRRNIVVVRNGIHEHEDTLPF